MLPMLGLLRMSSLTAEVYDDDCESPFVSTQYHMADPPANNAAPALK
jgi:hypothetical protein